MSWRYLAQRVLTGEWLDKDVPLRSPQITDVLSGPPQMSATISPELTRLLGDDGLPLFDEWSTAMYAEADGVIRFGGILVHSGFNADGEWSLEFSGFSGYAKGLPYIDNDHWDSVDPLDVVRDIWTHLQAQPDGDLDMTVDSTTSPVRLGKMQQHVPVTTESGEPTGEPYRLVSWEAKDCGDTIDELAKVTPFDYLEQHAWSSPSSDTVTHRMRLYYPRAGRRRDDLRFVLGENLHTIPTPERTGDEFCNEVFAVGMGEGSNAVQARVPRRDGRLRRVFTFIQSAIGDKKILTALARQELDKRNPLMHLSQVVVTDHPNARLGSWQVGDDILVQGDLPWLEGFQLWCRITSATFEPESGDRITLQLARSDSFSYGGAT